jgi:hypothetical protein
MQPIDTTPGGTQPKVQRTHPRQCRISHRGPECMLLGKWCATVEGANVTVFYDLPELIWQNRQFTCQYRAYDLFS